MPFKRRMDLQMGESVGAETKTVYSVLSTPELTPEGTLVVHLAVYADPADPQPEGIEFVRREYLHPEAVVHVPERFAKAPNPRGRRGVAPAKSRQKRGGRKRRRSRG